MQTAGPNRASKQVESSGSHFSQYGHVQGVDPAWELLDSNPIGSVCLSVCLPIYLWLVYSETCPAGILTKFW